MSHRKVLTLAVCAGVLGLMLAFPVWGQDTAPPPSDAGRIAALETKVVDAANTGHNAWMLTSSALVLFMTAPGLAMFYGGLVRKKNVLGVMMQCITLMGLNTVLWALVGYSLAFGGALDAKGDPDPAAGGYSQWIGNTQYLFMNNVAHTWDVPKGETDETNGGRKFEMEGKIPRLTHMLFQGMFFIITPALICGAYAERMKFSTMVVFSTLWGLLIYCPLCHWVWDGGILAFNSKFALDGKGALDFAGGTVVHISSGTSALICALVLGKRHGFGSQPMPPHNLTYTVLGAAMLWVGWFGFNAGSALLADDIAASAFAATHFAAAAGALAWAGMEWITRGKPSVLGAASGLVAGLVCITPASGYVTAMPALIMGAAAGVVCFYACTALKSKFGYDDSLDAFGVHGIGGTLGAVLTGVFATRAVTDSAVSGGKALGLFEGGEILSGQVVAAAVTWGVSIVGTFIILKVLDAVMGLRVSQQDEIQGLDLSQHGEEGYIFI
ncbi:MAG: ammonia channel protein [Planctomycetota bacterium]|nr:MAG: ammonia channel protein [Planctomycetota bacterium]